MTSIHYGDEPEMWDGSFWVSEHPALLFLIRSSKLLLETWMIQETQETWVGFLGQDPLE